MLGLDNKPTGDKLPIAHIQGIVHVNIPLVKSFEIIDFGYVPLCADFRHPNVFVLSVFNILGDIFHVDA